MIKIPAGPVSAFFNEVEIVYITVSMADKSPSLT